MNARPTGRRPDLPEHRLPRSRAWSYVLIGYLVAAVAAIVWLPNWVLGLTVGPGEVLDASTKVAAVAGIRQNILLASGGGLAILTLVLTIGRDAAGRRADRETEEHTTAVFVDAVGQLAGDRDLHVRIGGAYALFRIAEDSPRDRQAVMAVLAAFLVESGRAPATLFPAAGPPPDVRAAAELLAECTRLEPFEGTLELSGAALDRVEMERARLDRVRLDEASSRDANWSGASMCEADLSGAVLALSDLRDARLVDADLRDADLTGARLTGADLSGALVAGTRVDRADLSGVVGLTTAAIASLGSWDARTAWPLGVEPPELERRPVAATDDTEVPADGTRAPGA